MKLHANAALSLKGRRELVRRVVSGERTLTQAAWPPESVSAARANGSAVTGQRAKRDYGIAPPRRLRFRIAPARNGCK
jgi:hypothetical protein